MEELKKEETKSDGEGMKQLLLFVHRGESQRESHFLMANPIVLSNCLAEQFLCDKSEWKREIALRQKNRAFTVVLGSGGSSGKDVRALKQQFMKSYWWHGRG